MVLASLRVLVSENKPEGILFRKGKFLNLLQQKSYACCLLPPGCILRHGLLSGIFPMPSPLDALSAAAQLFKTPKNNDGERIRPCN